MGDLLGSPRERVSYLAYPNLFGTRGLEAEGGVNGRVRCRSCSAAQLLRQSLLHLHLRTTEYFALPWASTFPSWFLATIPTLPWPEASTKDLSVFSLIHPWSCFFHDPRISFCCFICHVTSRIQWMFPFCITAVPTCDNLDRCFPIYSAEKGLRIKLKTQPLLWILSFSKSHDLQIIIVILQGE